MSALQGDYSRAVLRGLWQLQLKLDCEEPKRAPLDNALQLRLRR
jgi:hypothetical protein